MASYSRSFRGLLLLGLLPILAGCPGDYDGGYEKVAYRTRTPIAMAAAPDPPPYVAGAAGGGGGDAPVLGADAPAGVTQEMVEQGMLAYGTVCTACHGAAGAGSPAGPQLSDATW